MLINAGKYIGTGRFRRDGESSTNSIECSLEIFVTGDAYAVEGHWNQYSKQRKNAFSINIDKLVNSKLENVTIKYLDYSFAGAFNPVGDYATGVFTTEQRTEILGVTVLTMEEGYRISGTLMANQRAMFDVKVLSTDPQVSRSNVVGLAGRLG